MTAPFYGQPGLQLETYALRTSLNKVLEGDFEFYLELAQRGPGPVLELGCGAGRLLVPFARAGLHVTGLDLSPYMLGLAAERLSKEPAEVQRRATLVRGSMAEFAVPGPFALVVIAFRSFQLLTAREDQRTCLQAVSDHLQPGGILAIDLFDPLLDRMSESSQEVRELGNVPNMASGNLVRIQCTSRTVDPVEQVLEEVHRFSEVARDGTVLRVEEETLGMRWIYRNEMRYLLELCGFEVEAEYSDYRKSPPSYGKEQIWVARRPA